jgi:4-diphosphocytidyl-2-C-methyl-D-erythritol kinase
MIMLSVVETLKACAKVNLTLEVIGKRKDGYHEIASVMQAIGLYDTLSFQLEEQVSLVCNIPELASPDNLVIKAAKLLQEAANCSKGVLISLSKGIPWASGLGGGSSDAAVTLQALNQLWGLDLAAEDLKKIALNLGSDIFFFLHGGGTALVGGRGERITSLPPFPKSWLVLMKPPFDIPHKTQGMYAGLNPSNFTTGQFTQRLVESLRRRDRIAPSFCYNVFEHVAFSFFPGLEEHRRRFVAAGAAEVHLVGSGPTLFAMVENKTQGEEILHRLEGEDSEVCIAETLPVEK